MAPLEAALPVLEARGDQPREVAEIVYMLVSAGFYCDRELNLRHRERAFAVLGGLLALAFLVPEILRPRI